MTDMCRFKVSNEYYIFDEINGRHLNLNDACDLLNKQDKNLKKILPGLCRTEEEVYILTKKQFCDITSERPGPKIEEILGEIE